MPPSATARERGQAAHLRRASASPHTAVGEAAVAHGKGRVRTMPPKRPDATGAEPEKGTAAKKPRWAGVTVQRAREKAMPRLVSNAAEFRPLQTSAEGDGGLQRAMTPMDTTAGFDGLVSAAGGGAAVSSSLDDHEKTCRICLESSDNADPFHTEHLIAPCQCQGTMGWVSSLVLPCCCFAPRIFALRPETR